MTFPKGKKILIVCIPAAAVILALLLYILISPASSTSGKTPSIKKGEGWTQINGSIFLSSQHYDTQGKVNLTLVVSGNEAAVIDTGYSAAESDRVKDYIVKNSLKLKYILATHDHYDHIANLMTFSNMGAKLIDFPKAKDGETIKVGNKTLKIIFTKGHYDDKHMSVEIVEDNILAAGDVVVTDLLPLINYGGDRKSLMETLQKIKDRKYSLIIPGHGDIYEADKTLSFSMDYLTNVTNIVSNIVKSGGTVKDLEKVKLEDCLKDTSHLDPRLAQKEHVAILNRVYGEFSKESGK